MMATQRHIEIFSAGCPACEDTIKLVNGMACASCNVVVLDMKDADVATTAARLGIGSVPAVVIDGKPADCCAGRGPDQASLRSAGIGTPLS